MPCARSGLDPNTGKGAHMAGRSVAKSGRRGHAVLEFAFFLPFLLFMFVGAFDYGFFAQALITTENAARVAAMYTSSSSTAASDSSTACNYALAEFSDTPNVAGAGSCSGAPLTVSAAAVMGPDGSVASQVTVAYKTANLIPIPGLLPSQLTITRVVMMKVRS